MSSADSSKSKSDKRHLFVDVLGIAGVGLLTAGSYLIYVPAGFIVPGVLFLAGAVMAARK